jgi:hypothetical protein
MNGDRDVSLSVEMAKAYVEKHHPHCGIAILGGSSVTGGSHAASDLDIVIIDDSQEDTFKSTGLEGGRIVEAFVLTTRSYPVYFNEGVQKAIPTLQRICAHGVVLRDDGSARGVIAEAKEDLKHGPMPWCEEETDFARYEISEYAADLTKNDNPLECYFIVHKLVTLIAQFVLRTNCRWLGEGKWQLRALREYDESFCGRLMEALEQFHASHNKSGLIRLTAEVLEPYGGVRLDGMTVWGAL